MRRAGLMFAVLVGMSLTAVVTLRYRSEAGAAVGVEMGVFAYVVWGCVCWCAAGMAGRRLSWPLVLVFWMPVLMSGDLGFLEEDE